MIFYDAIVYHCDALVTHMGMRILLAGYAVGCPACVCDTGHATDRGCLQRLYEFSNLAHLAHALKLPVTGLGSHAGRIIAAVFQSSQPFDQDGYYVSLRRDANYSAHRSNPIKKNP